MSMRSIPEEMLRNLVQSTEEVFETLMACDVALRPPMQGVVMRPPDSNVLGTVSFAGSQTGIVAFYSMLTTANRLASTMLGVAPGFTAGDMPDAIGEITNM